MERMMEMLTTAFSCHRVETYLFRLVSLIQIQKNVACLLMVIIKYKCVHWNIQSCNNILNAHIYIKN